MVRENLDSLEVRLCDTLCVNFHSAAVKDTSCTIKLLAKFELPTRASKLVLKRRKACFVQLRHLSFQIAMQNKAQFLMFYCFTI